MNQTNPERSPDLSEVDSLENLPGSWRELHNLVINNAGACSRCAGCVVACPFNVLGYDDKPFHLESGTDFCQHGEKGCTVCWRVCPRHDDKLYTYDLVSAKAEQAVFGRPRDPETEIAGIAEAVVFARATDPRVLAAGQDGGAVTAILARQFDLGEVDAVVTSSWDPRTWTTAPAVAASVSELLACGGSRYTYVANPLAVTTAMERGFQRLAFVGVPCQVEWVRELEVERMKRYTKRIALVVGLLCSETFAPDFMERYVGAGLGVPPGEVAKINVKGKIVANLRDGQVKNLSLKQARKLARPECAPCHDFTADTADLSAGGIGPDGWTMLWVRTARGRAALEEAVAAGAVETRPASDAPEAIELVRTLALKQRQRDAATFRENLDPTAPPVVLTPKPASS